MTTDSSTPETTNSSHVMFDGMVWPALSPRLTELDYALRYGQHPNMLAASVVAAYLALLRLPKRRRDLVVREIRARSGHVR